MMADAALHLALRALPCAAVVDAVAPLGRAFSWHPLCMSVAFVACVSTGVDAKRRARGRGPTLVHAACMSLATALAAAGVGVAAAHKEAIGHAHLATAHARVGAAAAAAMLGAWLVGALALRLDAPAGSAWRPAHRALAGGAIVLASAAMATGWASLVPRGAAAASLLAAWLAWRNAAPREAATTDRVLV